MSETTVDCPYCPLRHPDDRILFERELVLYCVNESFQGALKYSGIIIPKAHRPTLFDLTESELRESFLLLREVKEWLEKTYQPEGFNIGWNCGKVGGQEVMHAHMHVIPRFSAEPLAGHGIRATLKSEQNIW